MGDGRKQRVMRHQIESHIMLATGFNLCQGNRGCGGEITQLAAGSEHIAPATFPDERVKTGATENFLERMYGIIRRAAEEASGKWVERNQIDLTAQSP
jgi:hypothetical protein